MTTIADAPGRIEGALMSDETVDRYIHHAMQATLISVDTETSGIENIKDGRDFLTGISVAFDLTGAGVFSAYFPFRHREAAHQNLSIPAVLPKLKTVLAEKPLVFHNRKFDLHSLKTIGINAGDLNPHQYDTMIEAHLLNEELPSKQLDYLSKRFLHVGKIDKMKDFASVFGWENVPPALMAPYAKQDAELTLKLHQLLWQKLEGEDLDRLWLFERDFGTILFNMEQAGVGVDKDFCARKTEQGLRAMGAIEQRLGFSPRSRNDLSRFFFDELGLPVLKRSEKTGKPSLDKEVMNEYDDILAASGNESARLVLQYRGWDKAVSSLYEPMLTLLSPDGRVRTNFKQHGTKTGRLSSSEPNLQQIPRRTDQEWNGDAKQAFNAGDDDFELWGWDYAQLEFRLAASYGSEAALLAEFEKPDGDVFTAMAQAAGLDRQIIKTKTYATLYGAGLPKIAATLGMSESEALPLYERFLSTIPGIRAASKVATKRAKERGYVRYWTGRRRHFPYEEGHHKAFNSTLQGGASEIVKRAQIRCREVEDANCQMVLQVHDEIVFRIRKGLKDKYEPEIVERMTRWPDFPVKFTVDGKQWNK
ncbi:MAG TPA: DNA polymerase [Patescibacteria group bacterium]|nr:DNA polymerase [Patescibacteria group bacterium]